MIKVNILKSSIHCLGEIGSLFPSKYAGNECVGIAKQNLESHDSDPKLLKLTRLFFGCGMFEGVTANTPSVFGYIAFSAAKKATIFKWQTPADIYLLLI